MLQAITWLLAIEVIALAAIPIAFLLFSRLPDRGWALARPLGLLLLGYPLWLLGTLHILPHHRASILGLLLVVALVSLFILRRHGTEMREHLRREWPALLLSEVVFLVFFMGWVLYRAYDPDLTTTEKPMDFAFLNANLTASYFPPEDPWLRGHSISYYYMGYLLWAMLSKLTGVVPGVAYQLALALVAGMAAAGIYGLAYGLLRLARAQAGTARLVALVAPALLLVVGNLEGVLELGRVRGWGALGFWQWVGIKGLGPTASSGLIPTDNWWWWKATRVIDTLGPGCGVAAPGPGCSLDYTISEFPFFSLLLGDLHPHVSSLPFVLLFLAFALNLLFMPSEVGAGWYLRRPQYILAMGLSLGALGFINAWDLPILALPFIGIVILRAYGRLGGASVAAIVIAILALLDLLAAVRLTMLLFRGGEQVVIGVFLLVVLLGLGALLAVLRRALVAALPSLLLVGLVPGLALVMYIPFYATLGSQASGVLPVDEVASRPLHLLIIWGLFLFVVVPFAVTQAWLAVRGQRVRRREVLLAAGVAVAPFLAWALWQVVGGGGAGVILERLRNLLPWLLLLGTLLYGALARARRGEEPGVVGALLVSSLGVLLIMGPELFYVVDFFGNRMNTVFKLYYQAWTFLALGSSFGLYYVADSWRRCQPASRWTEVPRLGWGAALVVLVAAALYYPAAALPSKANAFQGERGLDGLEAIARFSPGEVAAIRWLQQNAPPGSGMVEAVGGSYTSYGRIAASTGLPSIINWPGHEHQWRGTTASFEGREEAVRRLYTTLGVQEAEGILEKYDITYVIVGPREKSTYGAEGLDKFNRFMDLAFPQGDVRVYRARW